MLKKMLSALCFAVPLMAMHEVELNLNNYDLDAKLHLDMGQFNPSVEPGSVFFGARYLHASRQHSDDDLNKDNDLFDGHFFVRQRLSGARALSLGMGMKFVYTSVQSHDFYALPLGLMADYDLPLGMNIPVTIGGTFYYSPQVLSWSDAKNYMEYDVHLDVMFIDRAGITGGYRKIDTDFDLSHGDLVYNETWFIGVKFRF